MGGAGAGVDVGVGCCWVAAGLLLFLAFACSVFADFFSTFSHCPWRDFISLSNSDKETKQRKRLEPLILKWPERAVFHCLVLQKNARRRYLQFLKPFPSESLHPHASPPAVSGK